MVVKFQDGKSMGKTKRRSEKQIVEVLLNHLVKVKGVVSQRELCSEVGINPKTVSKWLFLFQLIKNQCPDFRYELNGQSPIIIRPHFSGSRDEVKTQIHQFLDVHGIKMSELRKECVNLISEEIVSEPIGYEQKQLSVPRVAINEFKQELADALAREVMGGLSTAVGLIYSY